jgi:SAM-dependent methyltransferase
VDAIITVPSFGSYQMAFRLLTDRQLIASSAQDGKMSAMTASDITEQIRSFWDADAGTYDRSPGHHPQTSVEMAAWHGTLERLLPSAPSRLLDVGAGTGFLSLAAARLGHAVTAVDLSAQMLARLTAKAAAQHLAVTVIEASASDVPLDNFDVVMSRHLLWTLPDPGAALRRWREAAPEGRLLLVEAVWGQAQPLTERLRVHGRRLARRLAAAPSDHHADYDPAIIGALPFAGGLPPERLVELIERAGWPLPRLARLRDVEWILARQLAWPEAMFGVHPIYALWSG